MIVEDPEPLLLIGGAPIPADLLGLVRPLTQNVAAADGGANFALAQGIDLVAVVGDMDSLSEAARARYAACLIEVAEQETTDFDKALRHLRAPVVVALGFTGGRLDHLMGAFNVLARHPDRACVLVGPEDVTCLCPREIALDLAEGAVLSLYPLVETRVESRGLEWPTDHLTFSPLGRIGTSNRVVGPVELRPSGPEVLLTLPHAGLPELVRRLAALPACARWPARA